MAELFDVIRDWQSILAFLLLFGLAPGCVLRLMVHLYPKGHERRQELIAQLYALKFIDRPLFVVQQIERCLFEGIPARWQTRRGVSAGKGLRAGDEPSLPVWDSSRAGLSSTVRELAPTMLLGREQELAALAAFAVGTEGYLWQTADPWAGKTALAAYFVLACPPEVDLVAFFLSRRTGDANRSRFLQTINDQLAFLLGKQPESRDDPDLFRDLWGCAVERAEASDRHLVLVVDGLDEDLDPPSGLASVAQVLPRRVGGHAHVLVSGRRHPRLPHDVEADHPFWWAKRLELAQSRHAAQLEGRARQDLSSLLRRSAVDPLVGDVSGSLPLPGKRSPSMSWPPSSSSTTQTCTVPGWATSSRS